MKPHNFSLLRSGINSMLFHVWQSWSVLDKQCVCSDGPAAYVVQMLFPSLCADLCDCSMGHMAKLRSHTL